MSLNLRKPYRGYVLSLMEDWIICCSWSK